MKQYLLPPTGNFYKANLHLHTTCSDGKWTPEETKTEFMKNGYSIIAFTDHNIMIPHHDLSDENFLAITAYEADFNKHLGPGFEYTKCYHLNLLARDENETRMPNFMIEKLSEKQKAMVTEDMMKCGTSDRIYDVEYINKVIEDANKKNFLVTYNHPYWSMQNYDDYKDLKGLWGVEIMNTGCYVEGYYGDFTIIPFEEMLRTGQKVFPVATDDNHNASHCYGGFTMVKAENLQYKTVMDALAKGDMYSSTGPEIYDMYFDGEAVCIKTSPALQVALTTERRFTRVKNKEASGLLTYARIDISRWIRGCLANEERPFGEPYFRITVRDEGGRIAASRPYYISELEGLERYMPEQK